MTPPRHLVLALVLLAPAAFAGGRARYGGTLPVAVVGASSTTDPLLADTPADAARLVLSQQPLCRVVELTRPSPNVLRLTPPATLPLSAVTTALNRVSSSASAYRSLLAGVGAIAASGKSIDLKLDGPGADLERALCHPAFAVPLAPFRATGTQLLAVAEHPEGRPYVDELALTPTDLRTAERLLAQRKVQAIIGSTQGDDAPQLFVITLSFSPALGAHLRAAIESTVDRNDLARFFVRAPSAPLGGLLPPALGGPAAPPPRPAKPAALAPAREVTLLYDAGADDERAIAERLQVKLQPLGYRVALKGLARRELKVRLAGDNELVLSSLLLPPSPTAALAVLLDAAGQRARIPTALQAIAAAADPDAKARELAVQLQPELPIVPLATRGLGVTATKDVQHLTRDELGLPRLDDVFLSPE